MRATSRRGLKAACNVCNELLLLVLCAVVCDDPAPGCGCTIAWLSRADGEGLEHC